MGLLGKARFGKSVPGGCVPARRGCGAAIQLRLAEGTPCRMRQNVQILRFRRPEITRRNQESASSQRNINRGVQTNDSHGTGSLHFRLGIAAFARDVEGDGAAVDFNLLPVETPGPNHLDGGCAAIELEAAGRILLISYT